MSNDNSKKTLKETLEQLKNELFNIGTRKFNIELKQDISQFQGSDFKKDDEERNQLFVSANLPFLSKVIAASKHSERIIFENSPYPRKALQAAYNIADIASAILANPFKAPSSVKNISLNLNYLDSTNVPRILDDTTYQVGKALLNFLEEANLEKVFKESLFLRLWSEPVTERIGSVHNLLKNRLEHYETCTSPDNVNLIKREKALDELKEFEEVLRGAHVLEQTIKRKMPTDADILEKNIKQLSSKQEELTVLQNPLENWYENTDNLPETIRGLSQIEVLIGASKLLKELSLKSEFYDDVVSEWEKEYNSNSELSSLEIRTKLKRKYDQTKTRIEESISSLKTLSKVLEKLKDYQSQINHSLKSFLDGPVYPTLNKNEDYQELLEELHEYQQALSEKEALLNQYKIEEQHPIPQINETDVEEAKKIRDDAKNKLIIIKKEIENQLHLVGLDIQEAKELLGRDKLARKIKTIQKQEKSLENQHQTIKQLEGKLEKTEVDYEENVKKIEILKNNSIQAHKAKLKKIVKERNNVKIDLLKITEEVDFRRNSLKNAHSQLSKLALAIEKGKDKLGLKDKKNLIKVMKLYPQYNADRKSVGDDLDSMPMKSQREWRWSAFKFVDIPGIDDLVKELSKKVNEERTGAAQNLESKRSVDAPDTNNILVNYQNEQKKLQGKLNHSMAELEEAGLSNERRLIEVALLDKKSLEEKQKYLNTKLEVIEATLDLTQGQLTLHQNALSYKLEFMRKTNEMLKSKIHQAKADEKIHYDLIDDQANEGIINLDFSQIAQEIDILLDKQATHIEDLNQLVSEMDAVSHELNDLNLKIKNLELKQLKTTYPSTVKSEKQESKVQELLSQISNPVDLKLEGKKKQDLDGIFDHLIFDEQKKQYMDLEVDTQRKIASINNLNKLVSIEFEYKRMIDQTNKADLLSETEKLDLANSVINLLESKKLDQIQDKDTSSLKHRIKFIETNEQVLSQFLKNVKNDFNKRQLSLQKELNRLERIIIHPESELGSKILMTENQTEEFYDAENYEAEEVIFNDQEEDLDLSINDLFKKIANSEKEIREKRFIAMNARYEYLFEQLDKVADFEESLDLFTAISNLFRNDKDYLKQLQDDENKVLSERLADSKMQVLFKLLPIASASLRIKQIFFSTIFSQDILNRIYFNAQDLETTQKEIEGNKLLFSAIQPRSESTKAASIQFKINFFKRAISPSLINAIRTKYFDNEQGSFVQHLKEKTLRSSIANFFNQLCALFLRCFTFRTERQRKAEYIGELEAKFINYQKNDPSQKEEAFKGLKEKIQEGINAFPPERDERPNKKSDETSTISLARLLEEFDMEMNDFNTLSKKHQPNMEQQSQSNEDSDDPASTAATSLHNL